MKMFYMCGRGGGKSMLQKMYVKALMKHRVSLLKLKQRHRKGMMK